MIFGTLKIKICLLGNFYIQTKLNALISLNHFLKFELTMLKPQIRSVEIFKLFLQKPLNIKAFPLYIKIKAFFIPHVTYHKNIHTNIWTSEC